MVVCSIALRQFVFIYFESGVMGEWWMCIFCSGALCAVRYVRGAGAADRGKVVLERLVFALRGEGCLWSSL